MTVDYQFITTILIAVWRIPVFISEDYCVTVSITMNTTILAITTRLLFVRFFIYMCIYFIFLYNLQLFDCLFLI